ncbi:uncharacterized protein LOC136083710 [Hydra vulgaris]|uniref:Uncharacterized protein LOC136083710 n=1 Tax=Hydra vulgaris TaxID=6087 RepID=A0ABM4CCJ1_HYDVU
MSGSKIISNFSKEVSSALSKALETKGKELDERETTLNEKEAQLKLREDYLDNIFSNHFEKNQRVSVQVGNCNFETTFDVLLSHSNSYFHVFEWTKEKKLADAPSKIFIPRDPQTFRFVLEYLTYGKLFSQINDPGLLKLLKCDAQFYGLPELGKKVQKLIDKEYEKKTQEKAKLEFAQFPLYLKTACSDAVSNGGYFNWNRLIKDLGTHFQYDGISTFSLLKKCLVQISMKYIAYTTLAGYVNIFVNDVEVSRYHHMTQGYFDSRQINEVYEFEIKDRIKFQYNGNYSSNDVSATTLTFVVLHTY